MASYREDEEEQKQGPLVALPQNIGMGQGSGGGPAPVQQQPGMVEQLASGIAKQKITGLANEGIDKGIAMGKEALGMGGPLAQTAPTLPVGGYGAAGSSLAAPVTTAATETAAATTAAGGLGAGLMTAAPWLAAGYLGGKAFGLFRHGTPNVPTNHEMQKFNPANPFGYSHGTSFAGFAQGTSGVGPRAMDYWMKKREEGGSDKPVSPRNENVPGPSAFDWWQKNKKGYAKGGIVSPLEMGKLTRNGGV